tara:strand:+ start:198 stop:1103 length:906 start_codon:yes stop_codon:yes gene_type:complete
MGEFINQKINIEGIEKYDIHRFSHNAMATVFDIFIFHDNYSYALQAANESFSKLDLLEHDLSRFIENSDISRINQLKPGESTIVGKECMECLVICQKLQKETKGAFSPSSGAVIEYWKNKPKLKIDINKNIGNLILDASSFTVSLIDNTVSIDLGGVGKGYALDKLRGIFLDWNITNILLNGGMSTFLAIDYPEGETGWPLIITNPTDKSELERVFLKDFSVSGSGIEKGNHIISPANNKPIQNRFCSWSMAKTAAESDALSTSFMVMSKYDIRDYIDRHQNVGAIICDKNGKINRFGILE